MAGGLADQIDVDDGILFFGGSRWNDTRWKKRRHVALIKKHTGCAGKIPK